MPRLLLLVLPLLCSAAFAGQPQAELLRRFDAPEAVQAVAVDETSFYAIANCTIARYDKQTGEKLGAWHSTDEVPLKHLNSGVVIDGKLYCAHSNFPEYPNTSSVEIFDAQSLEHLGNHSFGIYEGSLTLVDRHEGAWWCVFAHYSTQVNDDPHAKSHAYTSLVKFDDQWRRLEGWVFPRKVLDRFDPHSCSGGSWDASGVFYATGHDRGELYKLTLPKSGCKLRLVETISLPIKGQGIALDRHEPGVVYGIDRSKQQVIVSRLPE